MKLSDVFIVVIYAFLLLSLVAVAWICGAFAFVAAVLWGPV